MSALIRLGCFALLLTLLATGARAEESDEGLIRAGVALRKQGRNLEALAEFRRAYAQQPSPRAMAQIALAEQALGRWIEAEQGLIAVLSDQHDPWIARFRAPLATALETVRSHLGTLSIELNVAGASVAIADQAVGVSPLSEAVRVASGTVRVDVQAPGYAALSREVDVPAGGSAKAIIVLLKVPDARSAAPGTELAARVPAEVHKQASPRLSAASAEVASPREARVRRAGWITLAAAAPLLIAGATAHLIREQKAAAYNDNTRCYFGDRTRSQRCGSERDAAQVAQTVAIVGYSLAGAALASGVIALLATRRQQDRQPVRVATAVGPRSARVAVSLAF
jgi:tetratricopeptide (TPR) repeat protein